MFSLFKYIDSNLVKDITKDDSDGSVHSCVWFTVPLATTTEVDKVTGEEVVSYEYFSFPQTARFDVEEDYISFSTETPYIYNVFQLSELGILGG